MRYKAFNLLVYGMVLAAAGMVAALDMAVDPYGLFHGDRGRSCVVNYNERTTKYLFAHRYIPEQFDALLVGSSITANWDTSGVRGCALYNGSLNGGNISEGRLIAEQVIRRRPPRLLLMTIHPYLTETYGRKTGSMVESEFWGALGSHQLLLCYGHALATRFGWLRRTSNAYGQDDFDPPARPAGVPPAPEPYHVDARALAEYAGLLEQARQAKVRIVGVIPPVEEAFGRPRQGFLQDYYRQVLPLFRNDEPIIDFNTPEDLPMRSAPGNFTDGVHLSRATAAGTVSLLEQRLRALGLL